MSMYITLQSDSILNYQIIGIFFYDEKKKDIRSIIF